MKKYNTDETFLARWLSGELTDEERIEFEKTDAYKQFKVIDQEAQKLKGPDINTELALEKVKNKLKSQPKTKVIKLQTWMGVAASVCLLMASTWFLTSSITYSTGIGEKTNITLADGSVINLNANSSIQKKRFFWKKNKIVKLTGEAYFTITKGQGFTVETSKGGVKVLGTQFNIIDKANQFKVNCFEGKVSFTAYDENIAPKILTKGMGVSLEENKIVDKTFNTTQPSWQKGVSNFNNVPFIIVLNELQDYYPIQFSYTPQIDVYRLYSGSFPHNSLNLALQATLVPMGIKYELKADDKTIELH